MAIGKDQPLEKGAEDSVVEWKVSRDATNSDPTRCR